MGSPLAFISEGIGEGVAKRMTARKAPAGERSENAGECGKRERCSEATGGKESLKAWQA